MADEVKRRLPHRADVTLPGSRGPVWHDEADAPSRPDAEWTSVVKSVKAEFGEEAD